MACGDACYTAGGGGGAEIEPCGKWMMQACDAVKCAPPSHNCMCSSGLVVWWSGVRGPVVQCSGVWPGCEAPVAVGMLLLRAVLNCGGLAAPDPPQFKLQTHLQTHL
mmetsp:Transcript_36953/g.83629  ORF Transcript_36953/g.83629 Transcript_36953/m.83629 type:complete len:107 (-) Transcript_36953:40-360(-)